MRGARALCGTACDCDLMFLCFVGSVAISFCVLHLIHLLLLVWKNVSPCVLHS